MTRRRRGVDADSRTGSGQVRIIGGVLRRTPMPVATRPDLRPTPDRVRETVFNWLGDSIAGSRCLDLFAGSGVMGFEAASRGASRVLVNDADRAAVATMRTVQQRLGTSSDDAARQCAQVIELLQRDAFEVIKQLTAARERFDLIFLDPPFGAGLLNRALTNLPELLASDGFVYVESAQPVSLSELPPASASRLSDYRQGRAGQVHYHLFQLVANSEPA